MTILPDRFEHLKESLFVLMADKKTLCLGILFSVSIHMLTIGVNLGIALALGIQLPLSSYLILIPVISFVSALPISVGGWGVGEALYASLLGFYGVDATLSVSLSILGRLMMISVGALCALAYIGPEIQKEVGA